MNYELQVPGSVVLMTIPGKVNHLDQRVIAVFYSKNFASVGISMLFAIFKFERGLCAGRRH